MRRLVFISVAVLVVVGAIAIVQATRADTGTESFVPGTNCPTETSNQLAAQSVPSASLVPCISLLGDGWSVTSQTFTDDGTEVSLAGEEAPEITWNVEFTATCDTDSTTARGQSRGVTLFEREDQTGSSFEREQRLVFDGGCVSSILEMPVRFDRALVLDDVAESLVLLQRSALDAQVRDQTDGDLGLDP